MRRAVRGGMVTSSRKARETVECATPAWRAMSLMVTSTGYLRYHAHVCVIRSVNITVFEASQPPPEFSTYGDGYIGRQNRWDTFGIKVGLFRTFRARGPDSLPYVGASR